MDKTKDKAVETIDPDAAKDQNKVVETIVPPATVEQDEDDIDYKSELDKVTKERDNYKTGMINAKDELKKKGGSATIDPDMIKEAIAEELRPIREALESQTVENKISSLTGNTDEQQLIKFHLENSIKRTGSIDNDLANARALANAKKFEKNFNELSVANKAKSSASSASAGSNQDRGAHKAEVNTPEQLAYFKKMGWPAEKIEKYNQNLLKSKQGERA